MYGYFVRNVFVKYMLCEIDDMKVKYSKGCCWDYFLYYDIGYVAF